MKDARELPPHSGSSRTRRAAGPHGGSELLGAHESAAKDRTRKDPQQ